MNPQMNIQFDNRKQQLEAGRAVVANWKTDKELIAWAKTRGLYLYVGSENSYAKEQRSIWHNPFRGSPNEEMMDKYREYLSSNESLMAQIPELKGKLLTCWCCPKLCHGDILAALANAKQEDN
jgi:hypothetical protein